LARHQTEASPCPGIKRQHRVQDHPAPDPLADLAKPAPPLRCGPEGKLARVLDCQHVATARRHTRLAAPARQQAFERHPRIAQKTPEADFTRPPTA
jgi:hypothetical protein